MRSPEEIHSSHDFRLLMKRTPFTSPKLSISPKKSQSDFDNIINDIESISLKIDAYAEKNLKYRLKMNKLSQQMEAITKALATNIEILEEENQVIEGKNQKLRDLVDKQELLKGQLVEYYHELCDQGVNLKDYKNVDYDLLVNLAGCEYNTNLAVTNKEIRKIVETQAFFNGCDSNKAFLDRCFNLVDAAVCPNHYEKPTTKGLSYLEKIILLQDYHDQTHARIANEVKVLGLKRDELLKEIKFIKKQNRKKSKLKYMQSLSYLQSCSQTNSKNMKLGASVNESKSGNLNDTQVSVSQLSGLFSPAKLSPVLRTRTNAYVY
ncbi:hypothetical protein TRFO_16415 [Tritrichomonas foetus]|uniref:Uncharacterized protein n=1 Tax=Tritrichomonas foetus TaxID=1144522 RepID=A0A1J4KV93_9EUKA|nr:hypothetical protein TRFO_16415 [Tritrichomonas foetus]|eukprot:OHT13429.1 hypothetical protein TRFO_16415 [Tritrichomonas foetus]